MCAWLYFYWLSFVSIQCVVCFQSWTVFFFNLRRDSAVFHCTFFVPPLLFCLVFQGCRVKKKKSERSHKSQHISRILPSTAPSSLTFTLQLFRSCGSMLSSYLFFSFPFLWIDAPLLSLYNIHQLFAYLCAVIRRFLKWLTDHDGFWRAPMSIILFIFAAAACVLFLVVWSLGVYRMDLLFFLLGNSVATHSCFLCAWLMTFGWLFFFWWFSEKSFFF